MSLETVVDLRTVIEADLGPPPGRRGCRGGRPFWSCPFHNDPNPSLSIVPGKQRWKCFGCRAAGDAIDWVRQQNPGTGFQEAMRLLGLGSEPKGRPPPRGSSSKPSPSQGAPSASQPSRSRSQRDKPSMELEKWQLAAKEIVQVCETTLWSDRGEKARAWLMERGLSEETLRRFRLGFNSKSRKIAALSVGNGITIPWIEGDRVLRIKIRCASEDPKYINVAGAPGRGLYPRSTVDPGLPCIVLEGEFDTLLALQELEGLASPVTYGSAGDKPFPIELRPLFAAPIVLVATDADPAGDELANDIIEMFGRARRVRPNGGKDLTEMWQAGVDLRHWASNSLGEFGWSVEFRDGMTDEARELFEERAAILEFDAVLSRKEAEAEARANVPRMIQTMEELVTVVATDREADHE